MLREEVLARINHITRKMVPITGRARSFLVFLEFKEEKEKRMGDRTKQQAYQFTQGYNILHRLQLPPNPNLYTYIHTYIHYELL